MEEKKSIKVSLSTVLLIIAIIVIGVMGVYICKLNKEKMKAIDEVNRLNNQVRSLEKSISSIQGQINNIAKTDNSKESGNLGSNTQTLENNTNKKQESTEDTIKELFLKELKEIENNNDGEKLTDYRVDKVSLISYMDLSEDIRNNYKSTDILAEITYSVKPEDINATAWIAGNGVVEGEWIVNKTACNYLRDGKLLGGLSTGW